MLELILSRYQCEELGYIPGLLDQKASTRPLYPSSRTQWEGYNYNYLNGLCNPEVQCRIHKGSPEIPILSRINSIPRIYILFKDPF